MKDFSLFSFILGAAGGAALAAWIIKSGTSPVPSSTGALPTAPATYPHGLRPPQAST